MAGRNRGERPVNAPGEGAAKGARTSDSRRRRHKRGASTRRGNGPRGSGSESGRPGCISRVAGRQHVTRLLAAAGVDRPSRLPRLLASGRVTVNGRTVRDTAARADPRRDVLAIDGERVTLTNLCHYLMVNKPYRVVCSFTDPEGRATLADYVPVPDVYAAGRLDYDSEGLVLLTDDGWLLHRITHPRYEHQDVPGTGGARARGGGAGRAAPGGGGQGAKDAARRGRPAPR